jgi:NAD(P)-dependent dehydrogenase (short-subunit alcohol dehydrogenase family)
VVQSSNASISKELPPGLVGVFVGATSGIGRATLKKLAKYVQQPRFYFVGRSQSAADEILDQLNQINPDGRYEFIKADVSLLSVVDRVCDTIREKETQIDILFLDISTGTVNDLTILHELRNPITLY